MLEMKNQIVKQLAMSRNHQNAGEEKVPYMSIAYTEVKLSAKQVDALMGQFTHRSWFNINGKDVQPMDWTKRVKLKCEDAFKDVTVSMLINGKELEFEGCRLYIDGFKLLSGGEVMADIHLHVMDAKDSEWNLIGRSEYTEVKLSTGDGVLIERKARRQRELFDGADPKADDGDETEDAGRKAVAEAGNDSDEFAAGVARAVGAHKKRGEVIDGRSERVKHQDRQSGRDEAH